MTLAYLYETTALADDGTVMPIRICSGPGYNDPSAPGYYEPCIKGADDTSSGVSVQRSVFDGGKFGSGELAYGVVNATYAPGVAEWVDLGWGQPATLRLGDPSGPYSGFLPVLTAKAGTVTASDTTTSIGWASRMVELDQPACPATFAGTNSGTTGLEGTADDIKGNAKPWTCGVVLGLSPVLLNASTRIVGWNWKTDGSRAATTSVDALEFTGSPWTLYASAPGSSGGDYPTSTALLAALAGFSLTQGSYVTCLAESLAALGGNNALSGGVTLNVTIEPTAAQRYCGALWAACLARAGVAPADIDPAALASLNAAAPWEAGYYASSESFRDVADLFAASAAACYVPNRLGVYGIWQMTAPAGTPVASFARLAPGVVANLTTGDLKQIASSSSGDEWTPVKQVSVGYARNWTVLGAGQVAAAVSDAVRAFLSAQYRYTAPAISAAVAAKYANAVTRQVETALVHESDAVALADILLGIFGAQRREYQATVEFGPAFAALIDLGATVRVTHPLYGMAAGRLAHVHAIRLRDSTQEADIKLWL